MSIRKYLNHFVLSSYLFCSLFFIFKNTKQTYGVNDDVIIQNWLSGSYTGSPEFMIRGSATPRISFGYIVSNLYELMPGINWFSILLLFFVTYSWYLIGLLALRSQNYLVVASYIAISFLHLMWFVPSPTYTASAAILSFSVLIFVSQQILNGTLSLKQSPIVILYFLSFTLRPESFLLGTAIATPFLLFTFWIKYKLLREKIKTSFFFIILIFSLIGFDVAVEKIYYENNLNWTIYQEWENARYLIQANAPEKALQTDPVKYGWSRASAKLFERYNFIDSTYFSTKKFNKLIDETSEIKSLSFVDIKFAHAQIFSKDINFGWSSIIQMIIFFFILFLILSFPKPFKFLILAVPSFVIIYSIILYIATFLRQPERVQVSIIFFSLLVTLVSFVFANIPVAKNNFNQYTIVCWLLFSLIVLEFNSQVSYLKLKYAGAPNVFWLNQSSYLSSFPPDSIFVGNASQFRNNWISPYSMNYFEVEKRILSFGWHSFSPHWVKRAENFGLNPADLFNSIIQDPRVFWVSDAESMRYVIDYMKEQNFDFSGPDVIGEIDYVGNDYKVWNFNTND